MRRDGGECRLRACDELRDAADPYAHIVLHGAAVALLGFRHALAQQPQRAALRERVGERAVEDLAARKPAGQHALERRAHLGVAIRGR